MEGEAGPTAPPRQVPVSRGGARRLPEIGGPKAGHSTSSLSFAVRLNSSIPRHETEYECSDTYRTAASPPLFQLVRRSALDGAARDHRRGKEPQGIRGGRSLSLLGVVPAPPPLAG